ncbi:hypothetical protein [Novosphingobium indicum]|uniref:hypothetical protein n=1 Tax=Novosphingobium indicum TaxID=462949 RepID=UPI001665DF43|nr:hypothetical protein [Novosphingobium indicum]
MLFRDLYRIAEDSEGPFIRFETLRQAVNAHHTGIGRVDVRLVQFAVPNRQAFYWHADTERTSPYEEEFTVVEIIGCDSLKEHPRERRFALTKELMHVFDTPDQVANTPEKFISLVTEIQNQPLPQHASPMMKSELDTRWMAALCLCPRNRRNAFYDQYPEKLASFEIAEALRVPEWVVPFIMDGYYDTAYSSLVEGKNGHA